LGWSIAGHDAGAQNWAMLASLIEACKLNKIEPHSYLTGVRTATSMAIDKRTSTNCYCGTLKAEATLTIQVDILYISMGYVIHGTRILLLGANHPLRSTGSEMKHPNQISRCKPRTDLRRIVCLGAQGCASALAPAIGLHQRVRHLRAPCHDDQRHD
jgi:hypothetical protein